jgi:hypothetical protein
LLASLFYLSLGGAQLPLRLLLFLDEKVTKKSSHPGCFFAAQALCAANQLKPKARSFCRPLSHKAFRSGKITNAFASRTAQLVLPPFARSCPSDGFWTEPTFCYYEQ